MMDTNSTNWPRKRVGRKAVKVFGVIVLVLILLAWIFHRTGKSRLEAQLEAARARGQPITFDEIEARRKVWADADNGALIIVELSDELDAIVVGKPQILWPIDSDGEPLELGRRWAEEDDEHIAAELEAQAEILAAIDRLADFEGGRFPLVYAPNPLDTLLPHLQPVRTAARLKRLDILHDVIHGDVDSVPEDLDVMLTLGRLLEDEPTLISTLVRLAVDLTALNTLETTLALAELPDDDLIEIEAMVQELDADTRLYWGMLGERAFFRGVFQWLQSGAPGSFNVQDLPNYTWVPGLGGLFHRDQAVGLRIHNAYVDAASDPDRELEAVRRLEAEVANLPGIYLLSNMLLPSPAMVFETDMRTMGIVRSARAGLAAERYRLANGAFSESLDQLVPDYLSEIPEDPFDGQPLRYMLRDDGVVIYSIGPDLVDDGGSVAGMQAPDGPTDYGFRLLVPALRNREPAPPPATAAADEPY